VEGWVEGYYFIKHIIVAMIRVGKK